MNLILIEFVAAVVLVVVIHGVLRHACDPRRGNRRDPGRHRPGRHTMAGTR